MSQSTRIRVNEEGGEEPREGQKERRRGGHKTPWEKKGGQANLSQTQNMSKSGSEVGGPRAAHDRKKGGGERGVKDPTGKGRKGCGEREGRTPRLALQETVKSTRSEGSNTLTTKGGGQGWAPAEGKVSGTRTHRAGKKNKKPETQAKKNLSEKQRQRGGNVTV